MEGSDEVDGGEDGGVVGGAGFIGGDEAGGPDDEGGADAGFVEGGFGSLEGAGGAEFYFGAVVGEGDDDGVVAESFVVVDAVEEDAELVVHGFEDGEVESAGVVGPFFDGGPEGGVDVIGPEVEVERFVFLLGLVDEGEGGVDESAGDFGAEHPLDAVAESFRVFPDFAGFFVAGFEGEREEFGAHAFEIGEGGIESVVGDGRGVVDVALSAHVPFTEVSGGVAAFLEGAGEGGGLGVEPLGHAALLVEFAVGEVGGDAPALWVVSGGDGDAGGGADGGVDVELFEAEAFFGEAVDVFGFGVFVAEAGEVAPAHVVDEDEDDVGLCRRRECQEAGGKTDEERLHEARMPWEGRM